MKEKIFHEFPSNDYRKLNNPNTIFSHKLTTDSGYPQQVLISHPIPSKPKNYLQQNKKNLKNFFKERLPPKQQTITLESKTIEPSIIFESKRKQHELKNQTKINLKNTIQISPTRQTLEINKVSENFQINDKNRDFRKKFLLENAKTPQPYIVGNHRRGTSSYSRKCSKSLKKQAYEKVFGEDVSSIGGKNIRRNCKTSLSCERPTSLNKSSEIREKQKKVKKQRFSSLIEKLDGYRKMFDPENRGGVSDYKRRDEQEPPKSEVIEWIQSTARTYHEKNLKHKAQTMEKLEDLQKLDDNFFNELNEHKKNRLKHREYLLYSQSITHQNEINFKQTLQLTESEEQSRQSESIYNESQTQPQVTYLKQVFKFSVRDRFVKVFRVFAETLYNSKIQGFRNKNNIYHAFFKDYSSYQLQGTYAFFLSIKNGDIEGMHSFISHNSEYLYQRDHKGRSPLSTACCYGQVGVVKALLEMDINVDHGSFQRKTPLFYALRNRNVEIVRCLLQNGATPWSSELAYRSFYMRNYQLRTLMRNSIRIHLAMKFMEFKSERVKFWQKWRHSINEDQLLRFV